MITKILFIAIILFSVGLAISTLVKLYRPKKYRVYVNGVEDPDAKIEVHYEKR